MGTPEDEAELTRRQKKVKERRSRTAGKGSQISYPGCGNNKQVGRGCIADNARENTSTTTARVVICALDTETVIPKSQLNSHTQQERERTTSSAPDATETQRS